MGHTDFRIEIYARQSLPHERILNAVKTLEAPIALGVNLDRNNTDVALGKINSTVRLEKPSKKQVLAILSDTIVTAALDDALLNFGRGRLNRGYVDIYFDPKGAETAAEIYSETELGPELRKRQIGSWKQVAVIDHSGSRGTSLDRRVFDYARSVAEALIPQGKEADYILILTNKNERRSIQTKAEFLGGLEKLVRGNCGKQ